MKKTWPGILASVLVVIFQVLCGAKALVAATFTTIEKLTAPQVRQ
jgi:hypothetical protein